MGLLTSMSSKKALSKASKILADDATGAFKRKAAADIYKTLEPKYGFKGYEMAKERAEKVTKNVREKLNESSYNFVKSMTKEGDYIENINGLLKGDVPTGTVLEEIGGKMFANTLTQEALEKSARVYGMVYEMDMAKNKAIAATVINSAAGAGIGRIVGAASGADEDSMRTATITGLGIGSAVGGAVGIYGAKKAAVAIAKGYR